MAEPNNTPAASVTADQRTAAPPTPQQPAKPQGPLPYRTDRTFDYRVDTGTPSVDWSQYRQDPGARTETETGTEAEPDPPSVPTGPTGPTVPTDPTTRTTKPRQTFDFKMPTSPTTRQQVRTRWDAARDMRPEIEEANIDRVNYYDRAYLTDLATQQIEAARQQYNQQIDQSMDTQARDLNRALADAQGQFQTQQSQIAADERQAMDNAALYAEARGDRGGIGLAQYNSIQNTAAQNRQSVRQAQNKLATDTVRQISDLRAQGEFEKADKMLELTQTYLSELRAIEEYAASYNLSVDQLNTSIAEWEADFNRATQQYLASWDQAMMEYTGGFGDGTPTYQAQQQTQQVQAQLALTLIQSGVNPDRLSNAQLRALQQQYGMTRSEIIALYRQSKKKK